MIPVSSMSFQEGSKVRKEPVSPTMSGDPSRTASLQVDDDGDEDEEMFESVRTQRPSQQPVRPAHREGAPKPSLEPYVGKLERFELFSTNQCYYIVACDKHNIQYRVLKMDRTLIEHPMPEHNAQQHAQQQQQQNKASSAGHSEEGAAAFDAAHRPKPTLRPLKDFLTEDPHTYSQDEIQDVLDMIHHGNRYTRSDGKAREGGGLKPLAKAYGIVGFVRFLDCYYLTLITRRAKIGSIGYNGVYTIKNVETFALKPAERSGSGEEGDLDPSAMLLSMWNRGKRSVGLGLTNREIAELRYQGLYQVVDFSKNFYFSYSYDLTRSLQENMLATTSQPFPPPPYKDMYAWNYFLTRELEECTNSLTSYHWVMPIIHGAFVQRKLNDYGRTLNLALIARRSRHFAGTRYLKRGVSEQGKVANDVEHEQIVHDESNSVTGGTFSSYLQVRGSIPTFWTQESSIAMPKPPIEINRVDPTYKATQAHFEDLLKRYGSPIVVLDLVKQSEKREREVRVGNEYRHAIDYINTSIHDPKHKIRYCALDYSHVSKHRHLDVSISLNEVSTYAVNQTGFFCSSPQWKIIEGGLIVPFGEEDTRGAKLLTDQLGVPVFPMEQRGVLRTNCIDCLDRTNVAQFSAGVQALEQQLVVMGIRSSTKLDPSSSIIRVLIDMYVDIGDHIALQYGGSEAHKKVTAEKLDPSIHGPIGKHKELLTSIRRYYSNAFTDRLKQDSMNLLLGFYIPYRHTVPLWEWENDYYLHNFHVKDGRGTVHSMRKYQRAFGVEWEDDEDEPQIEREDPYSRRARLAKIKALRRGTSEGAIVEEKKSSNHDSVAGEPWKITRVRRRLKSQKDALSFWWRAAIQSNIQQRMWMQLGKNPTESLLPPRFERIYQPSKLAQFDRFFARSWSAPVRRSHSSQHRKASGEDTGALDYRRAISEHSRPGTLQVDDEANRDGGTLLEFYTEHGYQPAHEPTLRRFVSHHALYEPHPESADPVRQFLGRLSETKKPCDEYLKYTSSNKEHALRSFRAEKVDEFKQCLHETYMHSDDVSGIQELAESAHIGSTLRSGPYRGLDQSESAVEITTVVEEQFNELANSARDDAISGMRLVDMELRRRGYLTAGVREAVARGWERQKIAQAQYAEVVNNSSLACRRSDITTAASLEQYASYFDDSTRLSALDLTYIQGERQTSLKNIGLGTSTTKSEQKDTDSAQFVAKASKIGITIQSYEDIVKAKSPPLFTFVRDRDVPSGFEQINEDLFARKDNKFMVFNGAGVDTWRGTEPITKVSTMSDDPLLEAVSSSFTSST